jgi:hypothetical protein
LATGRYKDNRIPPKGFRIAEAAERLSVPVWHGAEDANYFTSQEYSGGYDEVSVPIAVGADYVEVNLYYQTTSREYIEFLRDEINGTGNLTLSSPTPSVEPEAYIVQNDPFFGQLKAWGNTIWDLWIHNMNVDGAAPFLMTQATYGDSAVCGVSAPTLNSATPGHTQVSLEWSDESTDPEVEVAGYKVYYDQAGKAQLVHDTVNDPNPLSTTFTDTGLTNGVEYCYKVTAYDATCESDFSDILCTTPENQGQTTLPTGVDSMETGYWSGKGKNQLWNPWPIPIPPGETVVIRAYVVDNDTTLPVANATVEITIGGPETVTLNSGPSDANGLAEATWNTQAPNKKGQGGTATGDYTATTTNVTATGYHWDGVTTATTFNVQ